MAQMRMSLRPWYLLSRVSITKCDSCFIYRSFCGKSIKTTSQNSKDKIVKSKCQVMARLRVLFWGGWEKWADGSSVAWYMLTSGSSLVPMSGSEQYISFWFFSVLDGRVEGIKVDQGKSPESLKWYFNFCCWLLIVWIIYIFDTDMINKKRKCYLCH